MSKKKLSIIIIGIVICVAALSAILIMVKGKDNRHWQKQWGNR